MIPAEGLRRLDPADRDAVHRVAELHTRLLPESPVVQMGKYFAERFYYRTLVGSGMVRCETYRNGIEVAAFITWTTRPLTFMREGAVAHPLALAGALVFSLLSKPGRVRVLANVAGQGQKRANEKPDSGLAEILTLAMNKQFGSLRDPATGLRPTELLFERALQELGAIGYDRVQMMIREENKASLLFFKSYGGVVVPSRHVPTGLFLIQVPVPSVQRTTADHRTADRHE